MCTSSRCSASSSESTSSPIVGAPASTSQLSYVVAGMTCSHCKNSVTEEVRRVSGVEAIEVDLETKLVRVSGTDLDGESVRAAIDAAGYEGVPT